MVDLTQQQKNAIRSVAYQYGQYCDTFEVSIMKIVEQMQGQVFFWHQIPKAKWRLSANDGISLYQEVPETTARIIHIFTTATEDAGLKAAFCALHEIAHWILDHCEDVEETGELLYGPETDGYEAQASYFAFVLLLTSNYALHRMYDTTVPITELTEVAVKFLPSVLPDGAAAMLEVRDIFDWVQA